MSEHITEREKVSTINPVKIERTRKRWDKMNRHERWEWLQRIGVQYIGWARDTFDELYPFYQRKLIEGKSK